MTRKLEWGLGLLASAALVFFHAVFLRSAGALWRDEVNSVNLATMPLPQIWKDLQFDSFPVAWCSLLRAWILAGPGSTDLGIRVLGLLLGLGVVGVLWWNARRLGHGVPLVALALLGFDSAVICYGDSIRAYGLGMLLGLLTFGLVWEATNHPIPRRVLPCTAAAVVSVHCLFYNAVFLLAACAGGAAVATRRRQWRTVGMLAGMGLLAALSLLPYREMLEDQKAWNFIVRSSIDLRWIWKKFLEATASTGPFAQLLWLACAAGALVVAVAAWARPNRSAADERRREVLLYCGAALVTGVAGYLLFLLRLSYPMQPWYFLALMALVAASADGIIGAFAGRRASSLRVVAALVVVALALSPVWNSVRVRKTNIDRIASTLGQSTAPGDLVVVSPWYYGVAFDRYYRGAADWVTIPPMSFHKLHRYDLLRDAMASPGVMQPVLDRLEAALRTGHRIWWIGDIAAPPDGPAPVLPPASRAPWGWNEFPYYRGWGMQAGYVLRLHALRAQAVPVPSDGPVNPYENLPLHVIEGWRTGVDGQR